MSFWDHLEVLRRLILRSCLLITACFVLCLYFYENIFSYLKTPLQGALQHEEVITQVWTNTTNSQQTLELSSGPVHLEPGQSHTTQLLRPVAMLQTLSPAEGLLSAFSLCFYLSVVLTCPLWLYWILQFLAPALGQSAQGSLLAFFAQSLIALSSGLAFAYTVTLPIANSWLKAFNASYSQNAWSLQAYLSYTVTILLGNALAFELAVILLLLVKLGVLTAEFLRSKRRHALVLAFVLGALLTPPDVLSQIALAIPLYVFYELAILYAQIKVKDA